MVTWVFVVLAVIVILGALLILAGRADAGMSDPDSAVPPTLGDGPIDARAVETLRFRVGLRGYRMDDVDAAMAAMAAELRRRDAAASAAEPGEPLSQ